METNDADDDDKEKEKERKNLVSRGSKGSLQGGEKK